MSPSTGLPLATSAGPHGRGPERPASPSLIYRSPNLLVKLADRGGASCVVTFDSYTDTTDLDRDAFGERFFAEHGVSAIHVVNARNRWYHEPDWREATTRVREAACGFSRIVTYGSSMGAYAALRFADHVGATAALALSPQYSLDPRKAPFEKRWAGHRRTPWLAELSGPLPAGVPALIVYDPLMKAERLHAELIAAEMAAEHLTLPYAGHAAAAYLSECGLLSELVLGIVAGPVDGAAFGRRARVLRKRSLHYLMTLADAAFKSGRGEAALALARKATEMAPDAELGWHFRGSLLSRLRRHDEALLAWRRAAELAPEVGAIQLCFAQAQRKVGDYEGALATLRSISGKPVTREAGRRIATQMLALRLLRPLGRARRALRAMTD